MKVYRHISKIARAMPKGWSMHFSWVGKGGRPVVVAVRDIEHGSDTYRMVHSIREARELPAAAMSWSGTL